MKKMNFGKIDKGYFKIGIYVFLVLASLVLFEKIIGHLPILGTFFSSIINASTTIMSPFIMGFAIAFLINPIVKFFEKTVHHCFPRSKIKPKLTRGLCILLNYIIVLGGSVWIVLYLIPELTDSMMAFISQLPTNEELNRTIAHVFQQVDIIDPADATRILNSFIETILSIFENIPVLLGNILTNLYVISKITIDMIMAIFISFYMLLDKEGFLSYIRKIVYSFSNNEISKQLFYNGGRINRIFQDFIVGKALDSLIIGILAFVGFTILKAPFVLVLSLIIGVTNMIPYFGPFIGAVPAILITLFVSPITAIWVGIYILVLQQFDGNYLGPKILGNSLDLSPILIILAVVVGGALGGALGMFIGVPILATIKMFFSEYIDKRCTQKQAVLESTSQDTL